MSDQNFTAVQLKTVTNKHYFLNFRLFDDDPATYKIFQLNSINSKSQQNTLTEGYYSICRESQFCNVQQTQTENTTSLLLTTQCEFTVNNHATRMWANAQRDGRRAEYRWCPVLNAAKVWLAPTARVLCSNTANRRAQDLEDAN